MINDAIYQANPLQYGGNLKGKNLSVKLNAVLDHEYGKQIFEDINGEVRGNKFRITDMGDTMLFETNNGSVYVDKEGKIECVYTKISDKLKAYIKPQEQQIKYYA